METKKKPTKRAAKKEEGLSKGELRRLHQLIACLVIFGVVFAGRGINLEPVSELAETVGSMVQSDTDFQAVFAQAEQTFSEGESAVEVFCSFFSDFFHEEVPSNIDDPIDEGGEDAKNS